MKPCSKHRKRIAWLAAGALDSGLEGELRGHLETCAGCRGYLEQLRALTAKLTSSELRSDLVPSAMFHQRLVKSLTAEEHRSVWAGYFRIPAMSWRIALPVIAVAALIFVMFIINLRSPDVHLVARSTNQNFPQPRSDGDSELAPTLSNYHMLANRSLETLDEVLSRDGRRNSSPAPVYAASTLTRANEME